MGKVGWHKWPNFKKQQSMYHEFIFCSTCDFGNFLVLLAYFHPCYDPWVRPSVSEILLCTYLLFNIKIISPFEKLAFSDISKFLDFLIQFIWFKMKGGILSKLSCSRTLNF